MPSTNYRNDCTIVATLLPDLPTRAFVDNNGRTLYVREAFVLRILLEKLFTNCQVIPISQNNMANVTKMVWNSEVDIVLLPIEMLEETAEYVNYSYPVYILPISFFTSKPEQLSNKSAVLDPFSYDLWIFIIAFLFLVALLYYMLISKQATFQKVLFNVFGNVLQQQSLRFALKKDSVRWLLFTWLLGSMVIGNSYKAAVLSFLLAPTEFVIRDIPQLAEEANKHSVTCTTGIYSYDLYKTKFLESGIESFKAVAACLERNKNSTSGKKFPDIPRKKAHVIDMAYKEYYKHYFFVSDDYFSMNLYGYVYSEKFLLADRLNDILLRVQAAGLYEKYYRDIGFFQALPGNIKRTPPLTKSSQISLDSVYGAFFILIFGWALALITFFTEIAYYKRNLCVLTNA